MQTNLPAKVGDWFLKLKVSLLNWPTAPAGIKDFKVQYINVCEPPTSITPSSVSTQTYNLTYATALSFVVGAFAVNQTICPINYSFGISPSITPASVVAFDPAARTFTVQSNDLTLVGTYTITVTALSPNGLTLSPTLSFSLILVDPCLTAILTIDSSIIAATTTYTLADPEFSFPVLDLTKITSNNSLATCPALQVDLLTSTDGPIDSSVLIFTSNILKVYTTDFLKLSSYNLKL